MSVETSKKTCDLLIRADTLITQNNSRDVLHEAGVAISDGIITDIDSYDSLKLRFAPKSPLDLTGKLLMPGLVNAHTHLPMTLLRGFADDLPLMEWLENHIWPIESQITNEILAIGARIGCAELIRTGCTAFLNGYFNEQVTGDLVQEVGIRAVLGEGFFDFPSPFFKTPEACWQKLRSLDKQFAHSALVRTAITPHAAFTVGPQSLCASYELAEELDIPWQIHLAESPTETALCIEKYGLRPVELLAKHNLLTSRTTLHHCVDITTEEIELLASTGVHVVHNPASNLKLCSGVSPVQSMLNAGVKLGLGTDGASSNNQLNMFRDMSLAALVGKVQHNDASAVTAQSALDMATRGSASCLGWPELGQIEIGHPADIIALDLNTPNMMPVYHPTSHVVYATTGMEVCMTMVGGEVLYLYGDYKTLDIKQLKTEAHKAISWVKSKVKT